MAKIIIFGGPPVESIITNVKCFTAGAKATGSDDVVGHVNTTTLAATG